MNKFQVNVRLQYLSTALISLILFVAQFLYLTFCPMLQGQYYSPRILLKHEAKLEITLKNQACFKHRAKSCTVSKDYHYFLMQQN